MNDSFTCRNTAGNPTRSEDIAPPSTSNKTQSIQFMSSTDMSFNPINTNKVSVNSDPFLEVWHKPQLQQSYKKTIQDEITKKLDTSKIIYSSLVVSPVDQDVLFARGGLTNHHPGNKRLRDLVKQFKNK